MSSKATEIVEDPMRSQYGQVYQSPVYQPHVPEGVVSAGWTGEGAYSMFSSQASFLLGKVLTVVDAAITDRQQVKAVKDLIKQQFRDQEKWVYQICCDGHLVCSTGEQIPPTNTA